MKEERKHKRGGDVKKAPPGFYRPDEARQILDVTPAVFRTMVARGDLERVVPPMRSEGFYRIADVNKLANENALFYLKNIAPKGHVPVKCNWATEDDLQGIFDAVASLWGAENITPIEVHNTLYRANPYIDYVVKFRTLVLGYVNATPYIPETLDAIMNGRKRGIDLTTHDVLQFEPNKSYDVYAGIVVRQDIPNHEYYSSRLIYSYFSALCDLAAQQGTIIRRMYALSDQERGIKLGKKLGFEEQPPNSGRFVLDMETSENILIRKYQEVIKSLNQQPSQKTLQNKPISKRVTYDPNLEETFQHILETLNGGGSTSTAQADTILPPLIDQLAESPQMTLEQQALLKSIQETLTEH